MGLSINGISSTDPLAVYVRVSQDHHRRVQLNITAREYFSLSLEDREKAAKEQLTRELIGAGQ